MANSPVPSYQTFASQIPAVQQAGKFEATGQLQTASSIEYQSTAVVATGTDQATAATIPDSGLVIVSGANGTNGVALIPTGTGGKVVEVYNLSAAYLRVYPPEGGSLNNASDPRVLAGFSGMRFIATGPNAWGCIAEAITGTSGVRDADGVEVAGTWVFDSSGLYIHDGVTAGGRIVKASGTADPSIPGLFPGATYRKLDVNGNLIEELNWSGTVWE